MVRPPKGQQEDNKQPKKIQRTDEFVSNGDLYLQEALTEADFPQYIEDFTQNIREVLENLSHQLVIVEFCIKRRRS